MKFDEKATTPLDGIKLVPEPSAEVLNERQQIDYRSQREQCLEWLRAFGKDPKKADGYAHTTVKCRSHRMDQFYRWVWEQENGYTTNVTHEHADAYLRHLALQELTNAHKDNCKKALQMLYKWRHHQQGLDKWDPELTFSTGHQTTEPRDYQTREERGLIRNAAIEYGSFPSYDSLSPAERNRVKAHLAQRLLKPKSEITRQDWDRANGWKIPSIVSVSLDAALRPIEVERAVTSWVDIDNAVLRIPKEDSSKNTGHWIVGLRWELPGDRFRREAGTGRCTIKSGDHRTLRTHTSDLRIARRDRERCRWGTPVDRCNSEA
jgi:hypothetical protein